MGAMIWDFCPRAETLKALWGTMFMQTSLHIIKVTRFAVNQSAKHSSFIETNIPSFWCMFHHWLQNDKFLCSQWRHFDRASANGCTETYMATFGATNDENVKMSTFPSQCWSRGCVGLKIPPGMKHSLPQKLFLVNTNSSAKMMDQISRPRQNCRHFSDDICKCIFLK